MTNVIARCLLCTVLLPIGLVRSAVASPSLDGSSVAADVASETQVAAKKKRKKWKKRRRKKAAPKPAKSQALDLSAPPPPPALDLSQPAEEAPPPPVLDLSDAPQDTEAARKELLQGGDDQKEAPALDLSGGGFDFGGGSDDGSFDFGAELEEFDMAGFEVSSQERERFEAALTLVSEEKFAEAALEFQAFLNDERFAQFREESEYQLAKAFYKLDLLAPALSRFKIILNQGNNHRRYKKSVEWLFFISRKMADETPVLAELAKFRNVSFPKAYKDEYRYLLGKYLFVQAERFEVARLQAEELNRSKSTKAATFDFSAVADAVTSGEGFDFESDGFDFNDAGSGFDFGGESSEPSPQGGGFDFGAPAEPAPKKSDGFDFGAPPEASDAGFDFGAATPEPSAPADPDAPVKDNAPSNTKEAIEQGLQMLSDISEDGRFYARARYLEGLIHYLDGNDQDAVNAFQDVVRLLNPRQATYLDPGIREAAFLSLARIHYGYRQFDRSVYYYDLIDRDSENWLTALFEASWSYYRRGDFEKALGNLLTLHSPFFEREYFPESKIVKAIIYFEACRYPETRDIVDTFIARFAAVMKEIQRIAESKDAPEVLYDRIAQLQALAQEDDDDVTARLVSLALNDTGIKRARDVVEQIKNEQALWSELPEEFRQARLGADISGELQEASINAAREAGEVTRKKFERELYALRNLLAQALRIKLEVARAERETLQKKLRGQDTEQLLPVRERTVVDDESVYWPFEGEYWRDELGTYELDFSQCERLTSR